MSRFVFVFWGFAAVSIQGAWGNVIDVSSTIDFITPPASAETNVLESNSNQVQVFVERQYFQLPSEINVNITQPGTYDASSLIGVSQINQSTFVDSYFLHLDPQRDPVSNVAGTIKFNTDILGIAVKKDELNSTRPILKYPGTVYSSGDHYGIEFAELGNFVVLSADRRTVSFSLSVDGYSDNLRIVTVPLKPGDATGDGLVDGADYTRWADHFLQTVGRGSYFGDFNANGVINGADYTMWADNFSARQQLVLFGVPEPSTFALAGAGAVALGAYAVRRRQRARCDLQEPGVPVNIS